MRGVVLDLDTLHPADLVLDGHNPANIDRFHHVRAD